VVGFSVKSLENGILAAKKNIGVFEIAIEKERQTIKEYCDMIETIKRKEHEARLKEKKQKNLVVEVIEDGNKC
jgi:hypothetical protein